LYFLELQLDFSGSDHKILFVHGQIGGDTGKFVGREDTYLGDISSRPWLVLTRCYIIIVINLTRFVTGR